MNCHPPSKCVYLLTLALLLLASATGAIDMKGVSYTAWQPDAMLSPDSDASLAKAKDAGCNWIANHGNEQNVNWWGELDCIGIDAYYSLTNKTDPTLNELKTAWNNRCNAIENWRNTNWPNMNIVFAEVGYQNVDSTNRTPWYTDPSSNPIDLQEQADCYEALLSECRKRDWWLGAFWWNWETNPSDGGPDDPYWTPQNKPAEDILRSHYITLAGDLDDDRDVDFSDFLLVAGRWLEQDAIGGPDINCDGTVNLIDIADLARNWLP